MHAGPIELMGDLGCDLGAFDAVLVLSDQKPLGEGLVGREGNLAPEFGLTDEEDGNQVCGVHVKAKLVRMRISSRVSVRKAPFAHGP